MPRTKKNVIDSKDLFDSEDFKAPQVTDSKQTDLKLSDQVIGQLREILQLCMLSNTSFVDHARALRLELSEKSPDSLILAKDYVTGWNKMSEEFYQKAQEKADKLASTLATDGSEETTQETEVVISRDPKSGKLVGTKETKFKN